MRGSTLRLLLLGIPIAALGLSGCGDSPAGPVAVSAAPSPASAAALRARAASGLEYLEQEIGEGPWLLGDEFSAADVMMGFTLVAGASLGLLDDRFPALQAYVGRLTSRPALQKLLAEQVGRFLEDAADLETVRKIAADEDAASKAALNAAWGDMGLAGIMVPPSFAVHIGEDRRIQPMEGYWLEPISTISLLRSY